jgi:Flp pilus assembly protein TadD
MVMRAALDATRRVWMAHLGLMVLCGAALAIHTVIRVPVGRVLLLLPWLGVAATTLSAMTLLVDLLGRSEKTVTGRVLGGVDRRSLWLIVLFVPACLGASLYASQAAARNAFLVQAVRWLHYTALSLVGVFLLWTVVVFVNAVSDASLPVEVDSEVLAVVPSFVDLGLGDLVPHTQVDLRAWNSSTSPERLVVTRAEHLQIWVGEPVRIRLHAGYLGIPWVSGIRQDPVRQARKILEVSPGAFLALSQLTREFLARGQYGEVLEIARQYVSVYPGDAQYVQYVVGFLGNNGRYADAIELLTPIVARRPDYTSLCMLGFALDRSGDHHSAIPVLKQAHQLRPDDFLALHYLGEAYQALERYEDAIAAYEAELVVRPNSPEIRRRVRVARQTLASR